MLDREHIYSRLDNKLAVLDQLRQQITAFPRLHPDITPQEHDAEWNNLLAVLDNAGKLFPEALDKAEYCWDAIVKIGKGQASRYEKAKHLRFLKDSDTHFLFLLGLGTANSLRTRSDALLTIRELGADWSNPQAYDDYLFDELEPFKGHILKVIPMRFSITLLVDDQAFQPPSYEKKLQTSASDAPQEERKKVLVGWHHINSFFNVMRPQQFLIDGNFFGDFSTEQLGMTREELLKRWIMENIDHEDLHAFFDGFKINALNPQQLVQRAVRYAAEVPHCRSIGKERAVRYRLRRIRADLDQIAQNHWEEMAIEFGLTPIASSFIRAGFFDGSTFDNIKQGQQALDGFECEDKQVRTWVRRVKRSLNSTEIADIANNATNSLVAERTDKLGYLEVAYTLLGPIKIRHLPRLVKHWVNNKNQEENN